MKITVRGTRKHSKYQMHVSTWQEPKSWFERVVLRRRPRVVDYVGKGTKWYKMVLGKHSPLDFKIVTNRSLLKILKQIHP